MDVPPDGWHFRLIPCLTFADSEPEPDFAVVRGDIDSHRDRFPGPEEVGMVGEIAESSLAFDRTDKGRIYARAGIPAYWLLDVAAGTVEVWHEPRPTADTPHYAAMTLYASGQDVPLVLDGVQVAAIPTADLLP